MIKRTQVDRDTFASLVVVLVGWTTFKALVNKANCQGAGRGALYCIGS